MFRLVPSQFPTKPLFCHVSEVLLAVQKILLRGKESLLQRIFLRIRARQGDGSLFVGGFQIAVAII
jgi:hypothetical protein